MDDFKHDVDPLNDADQDLPSAEPSGTADGPAAQNEPADVWETAQERQDAQSDSSSDGWRSSEEHSEPVSDWPQAQSNEPITPQNTDAGQEPQAFSSHTQPGWQQSGHAASEFPQSDWDSGHTSEAPQSGWNDGRAPEAPQSGWDNGHSSESWTAGNGTPNGYAASSGAADFRNQPSGGESYSDFHSWNSRSAHGGWQPGTQSNPFARPGDPSSQQQYSQQEYRWNYNEYADQSSYTADDVTGTVPDMEMQSPKKKKRTGLAVAGIVLGGILAVGVFSLAGVGIYSLVSDNSFVSHSSSGSSGGNADYPGLTLEGKPSGGSSSSSAASGGELSTVEIAEKVKPSVVGVVQYRRSGTLSSSGEGSGIIMSEDGYIVTNSHVVSGADGIKVVLENGEEYEAKLIGADSQTDIAVIKVQASNLAAATFGDSAELKVGESVVAIGNPGGLEFAGSVTKGIVSALDRPIRSEVGYTMNCIQTDAAISPGNSGGPLVNSYGQVIGINSSKIAQTDYEGIGFAIPIAQAKPVIDELMKNGRVTGRVKLGITIQEIDSVAAGVYNMPSGILVISTEDESDVAKKGVIPGDIITKVNGQNVSSLADVRAIIGDDKPGDLIELTVFRRTNGQADKTFEVSVALMEDDGTSSSPSQNNQQQSPFGSGEESTPDFQFPQKIN
ncbi:trypsin-like peptidase domain-containing protein [Candidatus Soleaferrea massiliensis]|uniref:trypsin-like peptidase domain-containing protein n=1 Tax=Candidatus Soleaferrea massiliensis TaxID=1470354 RepID=UPI0006949C3B|nr:trypsin-like peptidase domain-containing protein [Candidatus Soleaferrea massiliensis]